jgi:hypothetical protein
MIETLAGDLELRSIEKKATDLALEIQENRKPEWTAEVFEAWQTTGNQTLNKLIEIVRGGQFHPTERISDFVNFEEGDLERALHRWGFYSIDSTSSMEKLCEAVERLS